MSVSVVHLVGVIGGNDPPLQRLQRLTGRKLAQVGTRAYPVRTPRPALQLTGQPPADGLYWAQTPFPPQKDWSQNLLHTSPQTPPIRPVGSGRPSAGSGGRQMDAPHRARPGRRAAPLRRVAAGAARHLDRAASLAAQSD